MAQDDPLRGLVAEIAAAYFSNAHVSPADISNAIQQIASALADAAGGSTGLVAGMAAQEPSTQKATPAQIRKSITYDALISFEDGKSYKTLKRHLATKGLTPQDYRAKWGLPPDYPSTAPAYSAARSEMAKTTGLGQKREASATEPAPKPRGRRPKAEALPDEPL